MRKIAFEEHFFTPEHMSFLREYKGYPRLESVQHAELGTADCLRRMPGSSQVISPQLMERLMNIGAARISEMDANGIEMQVLSLAGPGVEELEQVQATALARRINDELAEAIKAHPSRFVGFATIAYGDPHSAADEAERCVSQLGFKGVKINSHLAGQYLDHKKYWPLWERIEKLGVPVMLHPKDPPKGVLSLLEDYPGLTQAAWGFSVDASIHALRLICSGLFDTYPGLRIVLGHLGEGIPFWLPRIDNHWVRAPMTVPLKKLPSEYFRENFFVSTSGMFHAPAFECVYHTLGADRILFAVDYPYERMSQASFIDQQRLSTQDKEKICHANVEKLLRI